MGFTESSRYCINCKRQVLVRQETPNHTVHVLITLLSCGLWGIVWLALTLMGLGNAWRCTGCGRPTNAAPTSTLSAGSRPSSLPAGFRPLQPARSSFIGTIRSDLKRGDYSKVVLIGTVVVCLFAILTVPKLLKSKANNSKTVYTPSDIAARKTATTPTAEYLTPTPDPTSYKRGYADGLKYGKLQGNHPEQGGMPYPEGLRSMASGFAIRDDGTKEDAEWQRGWIAGFKKGFISIRGAGRNEADFENLSWGNAYPNVKLYNNDGQHVVTIVSTDPTNGRIKVRYKHDGTVEDKILEALSNLWFVRKDDPALR